MRKDVKYVIKYRLKSGLHLLKFDDLLALSNRQTVTPQLHRRSVANLLYYFENAHVLIGSDV